MSLEESQDTSIALSHLLANAVSKRVIDTVISKFSSSDTKQTNTNIKPEVLNRLKSLWLDNLASTPDCGLTIPRPSSDTSSSQGPTRGSSFKSARLTDPVPLSPEQYTNRGIRLAAPFLPPPTNPLHSDAALATVQSNSSTVGDSSSGALTKVLQWKHKLVLKRVSIHIINPSPVRKYLKIPYIYILHIYCRGARRQERNRRVPSEPSKETSPCSPPAYHIKIRALPPPRLHHHPPLQIHRQPRLGRRRFPGTRCLCRACSRRSAGNRWTQSPSAAPSCQRTAPSSDTP